MKRPACFALVLALAGIAAAGARAQSAARIEPTRRPFLWKIEAPSPAYLFGTIHLPDDRVLALPAVVTEALDRAHVFCSETRLDPETRADAARQNQLPLGRGLSQLLPPELYARTGAYLAARELEIGVFERQKVWSLAGTLALLDYLEALASKPVLDAHLHQRAVGKGQQACAIETVSDQFEVMDSISLSSQLSMLTQTLDYLEALEPGEPGPLEQMVEAYLSGDEQELTKAAFVHADLADPETREFLDALLTRRNRSMAAAIEARLRGRPDLRHFFALGTLHMPGPDGIVALLAKRGYAIERVAP